MTDVSNNLPPGVKPHDTDPAEPKPLAGKVVAVVMFSVTCEIQGDNGSGSLGDACYTPAAAIVRMHDRIRGLFVNDRGIHYEDLEFTDQVFESD